MIGHKHQLAFSFMRSSKSRFHNSISDGFEESEEMFLLQEAMSRNSKSSSGMPFSPSKTKMSGTRPFSSTSSSLSRMMKANPGTTLKVFQWLPRYALLIGLCTDAMNVLH